MSSREEHIRAALYADKRAERAFENGDGDYGDWLEEMWIRCRAAGIDPMDLHKDLALEMDQA